MDNDNPFKWREINPRQYERELDPAEMFYTSMAKTWEGTGHTYFGMNACLNFTVDSASSNADEDLVNRVTTAFKSAWMQLRNNFPTIAAEVVCDPISKKCKKVYNVPENAAEVDAWLKETFRVVSDKVSGKEFSRADKPVGRFATLFLLPAAFDLEQKSEDGSKEMSLLFRCGHDIVDGVGTLKLLNYLFNFATTAFTSHLPSQAMIYGNEPKKLSPPLAIAIGIRDSPTEEQLSDYKAIQTSNKEASKNFEVIGFPTKITAAMPKRSQLAELKLSKEETAKITKICKSFGVTATHLFHAAVALALASIQNRTDHERKARYITYALMNLRGICEESSGLDLHPDSVLHTVSVKHLIVDLTIPAISDNTKRPSRDELLNTLYCVRDFYRGNVVDADFIATIMTLFKAVTPPYPEKVPAIPEPSTARAVSLSSLGLIDKLIGPQHGVFTISDISISAGEYSTGVGLFFGTFNAEMKLAAVYNEAFHEETTVTDFLRIVKEFAINISEVMKADER